MPQWKSKNIYTNNYCYLLLNTAKLSGILTTKQQLAKLEMMQHQAARFVFNKPWYRSSPQHSATDMHNHFQWPSLTRRNARLILFFKIVRNLLVLPSRCSPQPTLV